MPDAVAYMLTGNAVTEYTVASTSEMLNPATGDLDEELLDSVGLSRSKFGPIVQPGHIIGAILPQVQGLVKSRLLLLPAMTQRQL